MYNSTIHHRRSIRLKEYDYSTAGWYYVTLCTMHRFCVLGECSGNGITLNTFGRTVERHWQWLEQHFRYVELDEYVIMPNHLHGIIILNDQIHRRGGSRTAPTKAKPLGRIVGAFKTVSTKEINLARRTPGLAFWQRDFYEHVIRDEADLHRIRQYIALNPIKWSLSEEYPENLP